MESVLPTSEEYRIVYNNSDNTIIGYIARRQCYVAIPKGHIYYGKTDDEINCSDNFPEVHGNITWAKSVEKTKDIHKFDNYPEIKHDSWIIGWDYNHFANMQQMMNGLSLGIKPTLEILKKECISVCEHCEAVK